MKRVFLLIVALSLMSSCSKKPQREKLKSIAFKDEKTLKNSSFRGVDCKDNLCVISGSNGFIFFYNHTGGNWYVNQIKGAHTLDFRDVAVLGAADFCLMSAGEGKKSSIYKKSDADFDWSLQMQNEEEKGFYDGIDFIDENNGVLIGDPIDEYLFVMHTSDGGKNWSRINPSNCSEIQEGEYAFAASGSSIQMIDESSFYIVTGGSRSMLYFTDNLGESWTEIETSLPSGEASQGAFSFDYYSSDLMCIVGGDYKNPSEKGQNFSLYREDKGWHQPEGASILPYLSSVKILNAKMILATGTEGTFLSKNAGQKWEVLDVGGYHSIAYDAKSNAGMLAGSEGRVRPFRLE